MVPMRSVQPVKGIHSHKPLALLRFMYQGVVCGQLVIQDPVAQPAVQGAPSSWPLFVVVLQAFNLVHYILVLQPVHDSSRFVHHFWILYQNLFTNVWPKARPFEAEQDIFVVPIGVFEGPLWHFP